MSMSNRTSIAETQKDTIPQLKFSNLEVATRVEVRNGPKWWWNAEVGMVYSGRSAYAEMWGGGGD